MSREPEPCCTPPHPRAVPWQDADDFDLALFKEQQGYEPSHRNIRVELTIAQVEPLLAENAATEQLQLPEAEGPQLELAHDLAGELREALDKPAPELDTGGFGAVHPAAAEHAGVSRHRRPKHGHCRP